MTRISDALLVQVLDDGALVIVDESTGAEIVIPAPLVERLILTLARLY